MVEDALMEVKMVTIKLVSNPYKKILEYFKFNEESGAWEKIRYEENIKQE